jgi:hypothetical protein
MHTAAYEWVAGYSTRDPLRVLDIGGRNINGSPRGLFPHAAYTVLDCLDGEGVDIVADAATWKPDRGYDLVLCVEVFEHAERWRDILVTAYKALLPGGEIVVTCAGPGRAPHSALDGTWCLQPGEWYGNVEPDDLAAGLKAAGFRSIIVDQLGADVRAHAWKSMRQPAVHHPVIRLREGLRDRRPA